MPDQEFSQTTPATRALTTGSERALLVCILFINSCLFYYLYLKQIMKQKTSGKIFSIWLLFLATYGTGLKCACLCLFVFLPKAANGGKDVVNVTLERGWDCQGKKGSSAKQKPSLGDVCGPCTTRQNWPFIDNSFLLLYQVVSELSLEKELWKHCTKPLLPALTEWLLLQRAEDNCDPSMGSRNKGWKDILRSASLWHT